MSESDKRDTLPAPPDVTHLPAQETLQLLVNWRFQDAELLRRTHALTLLCAAHIDTGKQDPRTVAQVAQTAEALAEFVRDELHRIEHATHELRQSITDLEELTSGQRSSEAE